MSEPLRLTGVGVLATVMGSLALLPVFAGKAWLGAATVTVVFVAGVGFGLRQLGTPRLLIPFGQLAALGWAYVLTTANVGLRFGFLPTGRSVEMLVTRFNDGLLIVVGYAAPLPYDPDLVVAAAFGVGLAAVVVDTLVATFRAAPWTGLPLLLLYSVPATTVSGGLSALAFIPVAAGYVVLLASESRNHLSQRGQRIGFGDRFGSPPGASRIPLLGQTVRRVGAIVIGLAVVVPAAVPALPELTFGQGPGAGLGSGGRTVRVGDPIIDLKRDLTRPWDVELMTYRTDADDPEYLRLVALDDFDGERWKQSDRRATDPDEGSGRLPEPPGLDTDVSRDATRYSVDLSDDLRSEWLPLPYPASAVRAPGTWEYDPDTLDVTAPGKSQALRYDVESLAIDYQAADLASAGPPPDDIVARYTQLPDDIPEQVANMAEEVVDEANARSQYDRAVALQTWFRSEFGYSVDGVPGHSGSALLDFLRDRSGYCEQFAAAMAIMARGLGIPARVGVGYTPGRSVGGERWIVTTHDSHAWPELYVGGYGWVRFEPTPYARVAFEPPWTVPDPDGSPTPGPTVAGDSATAPEETGPEQAATPDVGAPAGGDGTDFRLPIDLAPLLAGMGFLLLIATPALVRSAVCRTRLSRREPAGLAEGAWNELADTLRDFGYSWYDAATPRGILARVTPELSDATGEAADALRRVVTAVERHRYARDPGQIVDLPAATVRLRSAVRATASRRRRAVARAFPPSLLWHAQVLRRLLVRRLDGWVARGRRVVPRRRVVPAPRGADPATGTVLDERAIPREASSSTGTT